MKLMIDENIAGSVIRRLRQDGHSLILAQDVALGQQDEDVLAYAFQEDAVILTEDTDFGDLVMRQRLPSPGVIVLRLMGMPRSQQPGYIATTIATHANALPHMFTVLTRQGMRSRPQP